jgi:hypothetical protein
MKQCLVSLAAALLLSGTTAGRAESTLKILGGPHRVHPAPALGKAMDEALIKLSAAKNNTHEPSA